MLAFNEITLKFHNLRNCKVGDASTPCDNWVTVRVAGRAPSVWPVATSIPDLRRLSPLPLLLLSCDESVVSRCE